MWRQIPAVQRRINRKVSGDPEVDWVEHLKRAHLAGRTPLERCLSLCCWRGETERMLVRRGVCRHCTGLDISEEALAAARQRAADEGIVGIEYVQQDINRLELPEDILDAVFAHGALHHLSALEHVLGQINRGLKPGGLLVAMEYVGPSRFGYPARQRELATSALRLLPERYRRSMSWQRLGRVGPGARRSGAAWLRLAWMKIRNGTLPAALARRVAHRLLRQSGGTLIKKEVPRIVGSEMALDDPTEAVRSEEIRPLLEKALRVIEYRPYGGTLLMPLLDDIAGNFDESDPEAQALLEMLFEIEDALLAAGEIESDFALIVAGKRT